MSRFVTSELLLLLMDMILCLGLLIAFTLLWITQRAIVQLRRTLRDLVELQRRLEAMEEQGREDPQQNRCEAEI